MSLAGQRCITLSGPSWSWVSSGTVTSTSLWQRKPALLLLINSIADQEEGVEENPQVPLQNWFLFAPDAHRWLQLPEAPSEDGIEAAAPTHQLVFT